MGEIRQIFDMKKLGKKKTMVYIWISKWSILLNCNFRKIFHKCQFLHLWYPILRWTFVKLKPILIFSRYLKFCEVFFQLDGSVV